MNEELLKRLDALAAKLGIAGSTLFEWAMKQLWVDVIYSVVWMLFWFTLMSLSYMWYKRWVKDDKFGWDAYQDAPPPVLAPTLIGGISSIGFTFMAFASVTDSLAVLISPEWMALEKILKLVESIR